MDNSRIFPLDNYSQNVNYWLSPSSPEYNKSLLTVAYQNERMQLLKQRYFGTSNDDPSPWSRQYISSLLAEPDSIFIAENKFLSQFDNTKINNQAKLGYSQNKRLYKDGWIKLIAHNLNVAQFQKLNYDKTKRAIAVNNLLVRILPTNDPFYYNDKIPGEGYPFDNLQDSAIYVGTPLYIVGKSIDGKWLLVISPDIAGWVHSENVAIVDDNFIATWQSAANKSLLGVVKNDISIKDNLGNYLFSAYVGTILPLSSVEKSKYMVLMPIKNQQGLAEIKSTILSSEQGAMLPIAATTANISKILSTMQGRTYGWGNLDMYNDCSSELKNIFVLFGVYVQRNTKSIDNAGKMIDLSDKPVGERLSYLMQNMSPLLTLIHINGHVVLYIGKYGKSYTGNGSKVDKEYPLVYQQVWGLRDFRQTYRAIVGQSVFFPFLSAYPEDKNLIPQSSFSMFRIIDLTKEPDRNYKPDLGELLY